MIYTYDTEFHEDGSTIDFISIGIVNIDTGAEYYAVSNEFNTERVMNNWWLMENVMSSIDHDLVMSTGQLRPVAMYITDEAAKSRNQIAQDIVDFIGDDPDPELYAWYSSYDHVCLAQLWGRMIDLPEKMPMYTNDLKTLVKEIKRKKGRGPDMPHQPSGKHNALDDARFNVVRYNYLRSILDGTN